MGQKRIFLGLCFLLLWPSACMLTKDHLNQETELHAARLALSQQKKQLKNAAHEIRLLREKQEQCHRKMTQLQSEKNLSVKEQESNAVQLADDNYHAWCQELKKINTNLSSKINNLKIEINKRDSIIEIQEGVIRLLDDTNKTIETSLKEQITKKLFEIETMANRLRMVIKDTILFEPGSLMINAKGKQILQKIVRSVNENQDQHIRVESHTDNQSPQTIYSSNWELSAARAITVIRYLEEAGLDPAKLSAVAFGATRPVASNDTESGRFQNRRIELVLYYPN